VSINVDGDVTYTNIQGGREIAITSDGAIELQMLRAPGGSITLTTNAGSASNHDIVIGNSINTSTSGNNLTSGNVRITSAGAIDMANGSIDTSSSGDRSTSGAVTLSAVGEITLQGGISTSSSGQDARSGNIGITQSSRFTLGTSLTTMSNGMNSIAGDVTLRSNGDISFYEILSYSFGNNSQSGDVDMTSTGGGLNIRNIQTQSGQTAGNIKVDTFGDLTIADLLLAVSSGDTGGTIKLTSGGDITVGRVLTTAIGNAGDVSFTAGGTLSLNYSGAAGLINALSVTGTAGDVTLRAGATGAASLSVGPIDAFSYNGAGGSGVNLQSVGEIRVGNIQTGASQGTSSGNITINSTNGLINLSQARSTINDLRPVSEIISQFPSDPSLDAIKTRLQTLTSAEQSGLASTAPASNITLTAPNGTITTTGNLDTYSQSGAAGQVQITSGSGLTLRDVTSYGNTASGNLTITSTGAITTTDITTLASSGKSGNVIINGTSVASGNVSSIAGTGSGNITVTATDGSVTTRNLSTTTTSGSSGSVAVSGTGSVTTGNITSSTGGTGNSGNITVESSGGSVTTGDVTTESSGGNSGNIDFSALIDIITGNLTSRAGQSSGDITLNAGRDINTGNITSAAVDGDSGDINLTAGRDITAGDITSSSENGQSGDIGLVAGGNINTGDITTKDGQISLNADGTIATGDLNSDNAAIVNGELLETDINPDNLATIATQQRDTAIATIQADSSLNPNVLTSTTAGSMDASQSSSTSDSVIIADTQAETTLAGLSGGFLSIQTGNISLNDIIDFDDSRTNEYTQHFGGDGNLTGSVAATREAMASIEAQTGIRTGVVYISLRDTAIDLSVITAVGAPVTVSVPIDRPLLLNTIDTYRTHLINARYRLMGRQNDYAAQLYDWLIRPIAPDLEALGVETLMFSLDVGLRGLPMAALYDGEDYLIEHYSLSLIPSMGLIDTRYQPLGENAPMLAMGASQFTDLAPLPGVPAELDSLVHYRRNGEIFLNEEFTRHNIIAERERNPYPIVHLATHGEFNSGSPANSYIQLWDERVGLDEIRQLGWNEPVVELLVLSACQTALGDNEAEMGFAGLAVASGVKTAIASLWYVNDAATFMLMTELYNHLTTAPIKAEALRAAQLALLNGTVRIEDNLLYADGVAEPIPLPESLSNLAGQDFSNPYYWSAFTAIGAPW
ncbi:MAG: CHAT domain-containing protein, partial [Oscillatoriales cyanobacterium]